MPTTDREHDTRSAQANDLFRLSGKTAVVTGAGSGIGRAIAVGLAARGAAVVVVDVSGQAANDTAAEITAARGESLAVSADVRRPDRVEAITAVVLDHYGTVDVLVNNVGGNVGESQPSEHVPLAEWAQTLDLTVTTAFLCAQHVGRHMIAAGGGKIINIASIYGLIAHDSSFYDTTSDGHRPEQIAYVAAKGAVVALTRGLASYWARHRITVNAIAPGMVQTPANAHRTPRHWQRLAERTPLGRVATPDDLVGAAEFLASPASDYVTGQVLVIDGGWSIV